MTLKHMKIRKSSALNASFETGSLTSRCAIRRTLLSGLEGGKHVVSNHGPFRNMSLGIRICPGRYFADTALFLNIACVLHLFNIAQPVDESGNPIEMSVKMSDDGFAA